MSVSVDIRSERSQLLKNVPAGTLFQMACNYGLVVAHYEDYVVCFMMKDNINSCIPVRYPEDDRVTVLPSGSYMTITQE